MKREGDSVCWQMEKGSQSVGIVEVTRDNWDVVKPVVLQAIADSTFVALDTEFSGLGGDKRGRMAKNMEERYESLAKVVKSHSVFQLGVSTFKRSSGVIIPNRLALLTGDLEQSAAINETHSYDVQTFNFWLIADQEFASTPSSLRFLAESGLDFNILFSNALYYVPKGTTATDEQSEQPSAPPGPQQGNKKSVTNKGKGTKKPENRKDDDVMPYADVSAVIGKLIECHKSIVLHNGFLDLLYIYHNFIGPLASSFAAFVSRICKVFPRVYDTKYIADYQTEEKSSYLEYLYYKCERNSAHSTLFIPSPAVCTARVASTIWDFNIPTPSNKTHCCTQYATHGYCPFGSHCTRSHDIERILDLEERQKSKKRKRNKNKKRKKATNTTAENGQRAGLKKIKTSNVAAPEHVIDRQEGGKKEKEKERVIDKKQDEEEEEEEEDDEEEEEEEEQPTEHEPAPKERRTTNTTADQQQAMSTTHITKDKAPIYTAVGGATATALGPDKSTVPSLTATSPCVHIGKMHSAGFDAFATGYIYCHFMLKFGAAKMHSFGNHVYLVGKDFPLKLQQSMYK